MERVLPQKARAVRTRARIGILRSWMMAALACVAACADLDGSTGVFAGEAVESESYEGSLLASPSARGNSEKGRVRTTCERAFRVDGAPGPLDLTLSSQGVATDPQGNIYFAGAMPGEVTIGDVTTRHGSYLAKLDPRCRVVWSKTFGSDSEPIGISSVATDAAGNVVVAGAGWIGPIDVGGGPLVGTRGEGSLSYVAKYDPSGQHLFSRIYAEGANMPARLGIDDAGAILLTGAGYHDMLLDGQPLGTGPDIYVAGYVVKLDAGGAAQWKFVVPRLFIAGFAVAHDGSSFLTTASSVDIVWPDGDISAGQNFALLAKLEADGQRSWAKTIATFSDTEGAFQQNVAVSAAGEPYVLLTSGLAPPVPYRYRRRLLAFSRNGVERAHSFFDATVHSGNSHDAIVVDGEGHVLQTGPFSGALRAGQKTLRSAGRDDRYVLRMDDMGRVDRATRLGGRGDDYGMGMALDAQGNAVTLQIRMTGSYEDPDDPVTFHLVLSKLAF